MKILITGASGLLGKALLETKPEEHIELVLTWHSNINSVTNSLETWHKLDIRNEADVNQAFETIKPDMVIHCAAIGSVDFAEKHYGEVSNTNYFGTQYIVNACNDYDVKMVHISTNAVFSGKEPPYNENSVRNPINAYGIIKLQAEQYVQDMADRWLIIRPFMLYGWPYKDGRGNWASTIIDRWASSQSLKLVDDHIWQPTYAPDCAEAIWRLMLFDNEVFNVASPERATLYEFGLKVCDVFGLEKNLLQPVNSDYFPSIAERPKDTTYDLVKLSRQGIMLSDIKTGLEKMKAEAKE